MTAQGPNEPSKLTEQLLDAARAERPSPALSDSVRAAVERGDPPRASPPKGPLRWPWIAGGAIALVLVGWSVTRFGPTEATADVRTTASVDDTAPPPTPALPQPAESIDAGDEALAPHPLQRRTHAHAGAATEFNDAIARTRGQQIERRLVLAGVLQRHGRQRCAP